MARPVKYDRDQVVDLATRQFWEDGFAACDVETLTRALGLNRHSLYKSFGGKAGLFHDALEHYLDLVTAPYLMLLERGAGLDDIVAYFDIATRPAKGDGPEAIAELDPRGCLIANTAVEIGRSDPEVAAIVDRYYDRVERGFAGLVMRGQASGSIRSDIDPDATARWLLLTSQGLSVSARMGRADPGLAAIVRAALAPPAHIPLSEKDCR
ncbi:TetR/AcrR family transcriptional regulator [Sphingobium estronivorans]|uniref:TetR/AcrR family transcriptional regulator n=1 Tax=Sphingobium estronivorans TaxID=1577690 RepID=UPI001239BD45|nr:TetR family transcriptional regulator [Sphingobium estronivorans]